jgi:hypothetical protein
MELSAKARTYLIVSADQPLTAKAAVARAPTAPDLCVKSPSTQAAKTADFVFAGRNVPTIDEPLLAAQGVYESPVDLAGRYAEARRVLYELETRVALVIVDALRTVRSTALVLDDSALLRIAEWIESEVATT